VALPIGVRVDEKGRITLPRNLRDEFHIQPGDTLFVAADSESQTLQIAKAINPFDVLAEHAIAEWKAGKTTNLRVIAREAGIDLDRDRSIHRGGDDWVLIAIGQV